TASNYYYFFFFCTIMSHIAAVLNRTKSQMNINGPKIANTYCDGMLQSPINIVTANVVANDNLTLFSFTDTVMHTGHIHWGNCRSMSGSKHTVDGKLYSLHTVNYKAGQNSSVGALADPTGPAVLVTNDAGYPKSWKTNFLSSKYLKSLVHSISMDSLLQGVNMVQNYQYLGSLTVPNCSEDVVWIVFKDPIKVSLDLLSVGNSVCWTDNCVATKAPKSALKYISLK
uniref:Alpha-carbonic anhydrase domain-containing protein n=1 Tax=Electrophorus electricus TaxID=8005 RepID=A0AAY5EXT9_ELEEL